MAFRPHGDDHWPERGRVPVMMREDHGRTTTHTVVSVVDFTLTWYYNAKLLEGCHNIKTPPQGYKLFYSGWVSPAYACSGCDYVLLVPFPEVETMKELYHWFQKHLEGHL